MVDRLPGSGDRGLILIRREAAALAPAVELIPGQTVTWDRRFAVRLNAAEYALLTNNGANDRLMMGALGADGWQRIRRLLRKENMSLPLLAGQIPKSVIATIPALWNDGEVSAIPHFGYCWNEVKGRQSGHGDQFISQFSRAKIAFRPVHPLI